MADAMGVDSVSGRIERRFAELAQAGPRRPDHLSLRGRSRPGDLGRDPGRPAGRGRRSDRDRHAVLRPDGRRPGDPGGQPARAQGRHDARAARSIWCARLRRRDEATPIVLMGYYNPIWRYGPERFLDDARAAGVDGLIVVDLPPEEDDELCLPARGRGLHFIRLVTPTTDDRRLPKVLAQRQRLPLLRLDHRDHRDQGAAGRAGRRGGRAAAPPHARCRWRSASASARPRRRQPSRGSPTPRWSARRWSATSPTLSTRTAGAPPGLADSLLARSASSPRPCAAPGMARHELAHRLRPPQDQGAGAQQPARGAREPLGALPELRAHDLPPRPGIQPARVHALRPSLPGRARVPLQGAVRRGLVDPDRAAEGADRSAQVPRPQALRRAPEGGAEPHRQARMRSRRRMAGSTACRR